MLPKRSRNIEEADQSLGLATSKSDQMVGEEVGVVDQIHLGRLKVLPSYPNV